MAYLELQAENGQGMPAKDQASEDSRKPTFHRNCVRILPIEGIELAADSLQENSLALSLSTRHSYSRQEPLLFVSSVIRF